MGKTIILLSVVLSSTLLHAQTLCSVIGEFTSVEYAERYRADQWQRFSGNEALAIESSKFRVTDMCSVGQVCLIELRRDDDTLGYQELLSFENFIVKITTGIVVVSLDEGNLSGERLKIDSCYQLEVCPYFPIRRLVGDFYYPILIGGNKQMAVEMQLPSSGNFYTSPNIVGTRYMESAH